MWEHLFQPILATLLWIPLLSPLVVYYGIFNHEEKRRAREYTITAIFLIGVAGMILSWITTGKPFAHL